VGEPSGALTPARLRSPELGPIEAHTEKKPKKPNWLGVVVA